MEQELSWRLLLTNPAVGALTGAMIVSNLKEANHQKQIIRNKYRSRLQMRANMLVADYLGVGGKEGRGGRVTPY